MRRAEPLLRAVLPEEVELRFRLARGLPPILASFEALSRALLELVVNASEAMAGGPGCVEVETGRAVLDASEVENLIAPGGITAGPHVWLEVRDEGPGVESDASDRLCERGFSTKGGGRGHGLSEVREILADHRAGLRVSSRLGEGAAFQILLPLGSLTP